MQSTDAVPFTHPGDSSHGNHVLQGLNVSSTDNAHRFHNSVYSTQGLAGKPNTALVSSTSSSWGGQNIDSGCHHPSPPVHSSTNFQDRIGTATRVPSATKYYSYQHAPTVTTAVSAGNDFLPPSKGCIPQNYPYLFSGVAGTDQQMTKGATSSYHNPQHHHHHQGANGSVIKQRPYSPSQPSTYSSASSHKQPGYSYTSFHNTPGSSGRVQGPVMPHASQGQIISPSYSEGSGSSFSGISSGYSHSGSSTSSFIPSRKEVKSKDEDRSVEPNILKFTYSELSEATDGFLNGMVGLGSFGTVFRAKVRGNGPFAVKKLYSVSASYCHDLTE